MSILDNRIDYIEKTSGVKFRGATEEEKQRFVEKNFGETQKLVARSLREANEEMKKEGGFK